MVVPVFPVSLVRGAIRPGCLPVAVGTIVLELTDVCAPYLSLCGDCRSVDYLLVISVSVAYTIRRVRLFQ